MRKVCCCHCKCLIASKFLSYCWYWRRRLSAFVLTVIIVFVMVKNFGARFHLMFLLKYDFAESSTESTRRHAELPLRLKCYHGISTLRKYSHWFRERFKANIKLFLDKHDADNINDLSHYILPFGFQNENHTLIRSILQHNNFKNPPLNLRRTKGCIDCAVVGSGGNLNGSQAGAEIDSHDFVFRSNHAVSYGRFAQDVGTKTDFYIFYPETNYAEHVKNQNVTYLFTMYKAYDVDYATKLLKMSRQSILQKVAPGKVKIVHPDFFRYIYAQFLDGKSLRPTTGAVMAMLAIHMCDTVTLYGFGYDSDFTLHYYDKKFDRHFSWNTPLHDVYREKRLWEKLHNVGVVRLFKRDVM